MGPPPNGGNSGGTNPGASANNTNANPGRGAGPGSINVMRIAELVHQRRVDSRYNPVLNGAETGMTTHNFPAVEGTGGVTQDVDFDSTQIISAVDLMSLEELGDDVTDIKTKGVVVYVLLERDSQDQDWRVPTTQDFFDTLAALECQMMERRISYRHVLRKNRIWGSVGTVDLAAKNIMELRHFRAYVSEYTCNGKRFTTVLRESVMSKKGLTILLRKDMRHFKLECLAFELLESNPGLSGTIRVHQSRSFTAQDKTRGGKSKEGWRLVSLAASQQFYDSLSSYPESERFKVGSWNIQIRGGERAAELPDNGGGGGGGWSWNGANGTNNNNTTNNHGGAPRRGGRRGDGSARAGAAP